MFSPSSPPHSKLLFPLKAPRKSCGKKAEHLKTA